MRGTKNAIVTEVAPPKLATHLKLNADRYNAYADEMAGTQASPQTCALTMWSNAKKMVKRVGTSATSGSQRREKGKGKCKGKGKKGNGGEGEV